MIYEWGLALKKYLDCIYKRTSLINYSTFGFDQKPEHDFIMLCLNELLNAVMNTQCGKLSEFWTCYNIIQQFSPFFDQRTDFNVKSVWISFHLCFKNVYLNQKFCISIILRSKLNVV